MATEMTSSLASGYMTSVQYFSIGNKKAITAHYSAPSADSFYIETGLQNIEYVSCPDADPSTYIQSSGGALGIAQYFSGLVTGSTGWILILGQ